METPYDDLKVGTIYTLIYKSDTKYKYIVRWSGAGKAVSYLDRSLTTVKTWQTPSTFNDAFAFTDDVEPADLYNFLRMEADPAAQWEDLPVTSFKDNYLTFN